ncbi:DoxX family protein [Epilithonimonas zeae]|uniref:DoxX family protein n=1 Tax=Epilithonimonas zeae TaxID=1416779 RepID=UPI00200DC824|nr:DoxX family protein [Epilithonimonas zeae]UQB68695.1 DoxX family membrane protein [Epilithonimonas zeae]
METTINNQFQQLFLRLALAITLLSAVADRFGFWGKNSAWGNWENFENYTKQITSFLPESMSIFGAYAATFLETVFALLLILGYKTKWTAIGTGFLLLMFALSMSITLGIKAPLDYSVWIGSTAAFLLSSQNQFHFSIDNKINNK